MNAPFPPMLLTSAAPVSATAPPAAAASATFAAAVETLKHLPDLTRKVRKNLQGAIRKCAEAISPQGLAATVDVRVVEEWIDRISPERLGFIHPGSFSAFRSNLWRGLRLAGHPVPLGRYAPAGLSEPWAGLQAKIEDPDMRKKLSRLMHVASERGWPCEITEDHLREFRLVLAQTCLKNKANQTFCKTVSAWNRAVETVDGWPSSRLNGGVRHDSTYALPWSELPSSYRDDVEAFIAHLDYDSLGPIPGGGLRAPTKNNYRHGLRRAASILVRLGVAADSITSLGIVVAPARVREIIKFLWHRNGEKTGGHAALMAFLLLMVARDHVRAHADDVDELRRLFWKTADTCFGKMADRTWDRLIPFGDPILLRKFKNLPAQLVHSVVGQPVDISTAKAVRLALSLALYFETALPSGDVVAFDLVSDVVPNKDSDEVRLKIPGDKLNRQPDFEWSLAPATGRVWRLYVGQYRAMHLKKPCSWPFPRPDGSHWRQGAAYLDLRDACDRHLGLAVTPQLVRALIGKEIIDRVPGGHVVAAQVLGIKHSSALAYFEALRTKARTIHHDLLENGNNGIRL